jgi:hypothetical protein
MSAFLTRFAFRRIPWRAVWAISAWLVREGRNRLEQNLSPSERERFWTLMRKAKGRPLKNLTPKERQELTRLARGAATGRK